MKFILLMISSLILLGQQKIKLNDNVKKNINFKLKQTIKDIEGFYKSISVTAGSNGNIYLLDAGNRKILTYDPAGKQIKSFGKEGNGPGELSQVYKIFSSYNRIFVRQEMKVTIFNLKGEYVNDIPLIYNGEVAHFQLLKGKPAVITEKNHSIQILFYDNEGKKDREINPLKEKEVFDYENSQVMIRIGNPYFLDNTLLIKSFGQDYKLGFYNTDMILKKVITKDFTKVPRDLSKYNIDVDIDDSSLSKEEIARQKQEAMKNILKQIGKYEDDIQSILGTINNILFYRVASDKANEIRIHGLKNDELICKIYLKLENRVYESRIENNLLILSLKDPEEGPYAKIYTLN